ncbi:hypothetical protein [Reinekea marinisedimentorum]|nr:hypothetical protein [Reinekea marinisedimentorum]
MTQTLASQNPTDALITQLSAGKAVALGDAHWYGDIFEQITDLVLSDAVLAVCHTLVLEMGARSHQAWLNDYLCGKADNEAGRLQQLLLDSLVFPAWFAPCYLQFFKRLRKKNRKRTASGQPSIRVLLAEPEFSWCEIRTVQQYRMLCAQRDQSLFEAVHGLQAENQSCIVLCGAWHILKQTPDGMPSSFGALMQSAHAECFFSIWPHMQMQAPAHLSQQQLPVLIDCRQSALGDLPLSEIVPAMRQDGRAVAITVRDAVDGYLYLGPQKRRSDYDFSIWQGIDAQLVVERARLLGERQRMVVEQVLSAVVQG